jgi:hypothetical protein
MGKQKVQSWLRIVVVLIAAAALVGAGAVLAQRAIPGTEPGGEVTESKASFDSYLDAGIVIPENGLDASGEPFVIPQGIAPDDNPVESVERTSETSATDAVFYYYQVSGATLRGRNSSTEYEYDVVGCSHVTVGSGTGRILNTELPIPDGATIKYLRVYYRDVNPASGIEGYITRYQPGVGTADLVHTGSTNLFAGGYGFVVSQEITSTVNNKDYVYTLIGWPDEANVANQICGLRVAYYLPQNNLAFLPAISSR